MYCKKCGFKLPEDSVFCPNCGNKIVSITAKHFFDEGSEPPHRGRENLTRSRKLFSIYIIVIILLLGVIVVRFLFPNLTATAYNLITKRAPVFEQAQNVPSPPLPVLKQTQNPSTSLTPEPIASPDPSPIPYEDLKGLVNKLNAEEKKAPMPDKNGYKSFAAFQVGDEQNTIIYKFAFEAFTDAIRYAQGGDAECLKAYYRLLESLPALEDSLENALWVAMPMLNVKVVLMVDEIASNVAAVFDNGKIEYDIMNGIGKIPVGITPIQ